LRRYARIAAIACGCIVLGFALGNWIAGPALSKGTAVKAQAATAPQGISGIATPDPLVFRTPTPDFGAGAPNYAAAAKEKAKDEIAGRGSARDIANTDDDRGSRDDNSWRQTTGAAPGHRYRPRDRFTVY
jgi:hypothetical protein